MKSRPGNNRTQQWGPHEQELLGDRDNHGACVKAVLHRDFLHLQSPYRVINTSPA